MTELYIKGQFIDSETYRRNVLARFDKARASVAEAMEKSCADPVSDELSRRLQASQTRLEEISNRLNEVKQEGQEVL